MENLSWAMASFAEAVLPARMLPRIQAAHPAYWCRPNSAANCRLEIFRPNPIANCSWIAFACSGFLIHSKIGVAQVWGTE
jgi:hypothetical protein